MLKKTSKTSFEVLISMSLVARSSYSNPTIKLLSTSPQSNIAMKLVCPEGLPNLALPLKELE